MFSSALRNSNLLETAKVRYSEIWFAAANLPRYCLLLAKLGSLILTSFATAKYGSLQRIGPSLPFATFRCSECTVSGFLSECLEFATAKESSLQRMLCFLV